MGGVVATGANAFRRDGTLEGGTQGTSEGGTQTSMASASGDEGLGGDGADDGKDEEEFMVCALCTYCFDSCLIECR